MSGNELPEPVAIFPNALPVRLWRQRKMPAAVTIRCGRGKRRCDRVAFIYETPDSAVIVFHQHRPDVPMTMPRELAEQRVEFDDLKAWDGESETILTRGRRDEAGTVVTLERDDYWSNVVEVGCTHHLGLVALSRSDLMALLRRARSRGTSIEHSVS